MPQIENKKIQFGKLKMKMGKIFLPINIFLGKLIFFFGKLYMEQRENDMGKLMKVIVNFPLYFSNRDNEHIGAYASLEEIKDIVDIFRSQKVQAQMGGLWSCL